MLYLYRMIKLRDILNEIGDTTTTYPYEMDFELKRIGRETDGFYRSLYTFTANDYTTNSEGMKFYVTIEAYEMYDEEGNTIPNPTVDIAFTAGSTGFGATNKGLKQAFRVMATVIQIAKDFADKYDWVKAYKFSVSDTVKNDTESKKNLYLAFVKNQFPGATIKDQSDTSGDIYVKFR